MSYASNAPPRPAVQQTYILYGALFATSFLYLAVGLFIAGESSAGDLTLPAVLALVALGSAGVSLVLPKQLFARALGELTPEVHLVERASPDSVFSDQRAQHRVFAAPDALRQQLFQRRLSSLLFALALSESIAIYGLILLILGHGLGLALPFFIASWALFLLHRPRARSLEQAAEARFDASFP